MHRTQAVGTGISAAKNDDVAPLRADHRLGAVDHGAIGRLEVRHGRDHPVEVRPRDRNAAAGESSRLRAAPRRSWRAVSRAASRRLADRHPRAKLDARLAHHLEATVEDGLFHLELRDAVAQQSADRVAALEDRDRVTDAAQLSRGGETGRSRADDRDRAPGLGADVGTRHGDAAGEGVLGHLVLEAFDGDRIVR